MHASYDTPEKKKPKKKGEKNDNRNSSPQHSQSVQNDSPRAQTKIQFSCPERTDMVSRIAIGCTTKKTRINCNYSSRWPRLVLVSTLCLSAENWSNEGGILMGGWTYRHETITAPQLESTNRLIDLFYMFLSCGGSIANFCYRFFFFF